MQLEQTSVAADLKRLIRYLPLAARQACLPPATRTLHREILKFLYQQARAPVSADFGETLPAATPELYERLQSLAAKDLLVLDSDTGLPLGAYPLTSEKTPHRLSINNRQIYAMCALDAVSVGPMFGGEVEIASLCQQTATPISIRMCGQDILAVSPDSNCLVGIRWQSPGTVAAYSMCMQMVFFRDLDAANVWCNHDQSGISLLSLPDAVTLGSSFFRPLFAGSE